MVVSIPLWFDCNNHDGKYLGVVVESPSHYGSTATCLCSQSDKVPTESLHPTMVRLQPTLSGTRREGLSEQSPSHYGSTATDLLVTLRGHRKRCLHPTMVRLQHVRVIAQDLTQVRLHPTMVRLQLIFVTSWCFFGSIVSIPLWFDCNPG